MPHVQQCIFYGWTGQLQPTNNNPADISPSNNVWFWDYAGENPEMYIQTLKLCPMRMPKN
jgi:hypothetical protein